MTMKIAVVGTGGVAERNYLPYIAEREGIRAQLLLTARAARQRQWRSSSAGAWRRMRPT